MTRLFVILAFFFVSLPAFAVSFSTDQSGNTVAQTLAVGTNTLTTGTVLDLGSNTSAMLLPVGTTVQEPTGVAGMLRFNSTTPGVEAFYNSAWNTLVQTTNPVVTGISSDSYTATGTSPPTIGLYAPATNTVGLSARSLPIIEGTNPGSAVDYFLFTGAATADPATITIGAAGSDSNINMNLTTAGSGQVEANGLPVIDKVVKQVFTSSGTYTPTTGMVYADVEAVGGGGGSGGSASTTATQNAQGGGGGGGGYVEKVFTAATIGSSQTVTIGAGGTAGSAGNHAGGSGGNTTFGSLLTADGGGGGSGGAAATISAGAFTGGGNGGGASGGDKNIPGSTGGQVILAPLLGYVIGGSGATSHVSGSVSGATGTGSGTTGSAYGGGAGGAGSSQSASAQAGGAGAGGAVWITEYVSQ